MNNIMLAAHVLEQLRKILPGLPEHITCLDLHLAYGEIPEVTVGFYLESAPQDEVVTETFEIQPISRVSAPVAP